MRLSIINKLLLLSITLALAACNGGSGGGSSVNANSAPVIDGGDTASETVDENTTAVSTVTASDSDSGDTLTFSLSGGADQSQFSITTAGVLSFSSAPNFEAPVDADTNNTYIVEVQVSDGTATDTQTITVTVNDVNEVSSVSGGGIKGPLVGAIVTAYEVDTTNTAGGFKGDVAGVPGTTDAQAQITGLGIPSPATPPYILEFSSDANTTDILTGQFPVISEMRTIITTNLLESGEKIYATPLTTMAVDLAIKNADVSTGAWARDERDLDTDDDGIDEFTISLGDSIVTTDELLTALPIAAAQVKSTMGFGMDADIDLFDTPPLIDSTTDSEDKQEQAAAYRAAVEAVTAVVDQIDDATGTDDPNSVLSSLTADLADGQIDGKFDDENGTQQNSEIFGGTDDDAEETATAALQLLEQDPTTLPIPNDPQGRTVGQMKQVINDEKEDLGNAEVQTEIETTEEVELKPAETNPDIDGDGVPNDKDAFPEDDSETVDTDNDGLGNNADTDDDNDGVIDSNDAFPLDPAEQKDTDSDGIGNNADTDDDNDNVEDSADDFPLDSTRQNKSDQDNDGWPSEQDADDNDASVPTATFVDTDGDGVANGTGGTAGSDTDDDNDGVENSLDAFPRDATEQKDTDGDGVGDNADTDIDGDGVANADDKFPRNPFETKDTDRDGIGNNTDEDDDGDGVSDAQESQNGSDPLKRDTDGDGALDNVDNAPLDPNVQFDSDKDAIDNSDDNCPVHYNPSQSNIDGDERGDACDKDKDGDGIENSEDAFPEDDSETLDTDSDGIGNNADTDDDNDGVADADDAFPLDASEIKDTDSDGTGDNADNDRDGDGTDNANDAFPNDSTEDTDTDGDGIGNNTDDDDDGDGTLDVDDAAPLNASASTDTDGDGEPNTTDTDDDGDGVDDANDAFPLNANETTDTDGDGIGDNSDSDIDGDGVANDNDRFPTDKNEYLDTDNDGTGDNADTDKDGDGTDNSADAFPLNPSEDTDTDQDGLGNNADTDDDNDGLSDTAEASKGSNPLLRDTDSDGRRDGTDNCPTDANANQRDSDSDGLGDVCDADDDGDSVADSTDNCPLAPNVNQNDLDSDGQGDACDTDRDGDGVLNTVDNCPVNDNANQADADGNGIGDACDADTDQDGVVDVLDNCPAIANADQLDTDSDTQGNVCDTDDDNDGLSDTEEATKGTNPLKADSDGDGVNDNNDAFPTDASETKDTDGDGIGDNADNNKDTDSIIDSEDNCPLIDNENQLDTDSDGKGNACDNDDDGDGVNDANDVFPLDPTESKDQDGDQVGDKADNCPLTANNDQADSDQDGKGNACDTDNDNDGVADDVDNCPAVANPGQLDQDQDGQGNLCDSDDDGDSVLDSTDNCPLASNSGQEDQDSDGKGDACDSDRDGDGLSNADELALGTNPDAGDTDSDGTDDGIDNCPTKSNSDQENTDSDAKGNACDTDDDNDGVSDEDELLNGSNPLLADTDEDGVNDDTDNCPTIANGANEDNQADSNGNGTGDACESLVDISGFWKVQRTLTATSHSGDASWCEGDIGDVEAAVVRIEQDDAKIDILFADNDFQPDGDTGTVNAAADVNWNAEDTFNEYHNADGSVSGSVEESWSFSGTADDASSPMVITDSSATEINTLYDDEDQTGDVLSNCQFTYTAVLTRMNQVNAADVLSPTSSHQGMSYSDAWHQYVDETQEDVYEFEYGLIDSVNGEQNFEWNDVNQAWEQFTPESGYMLSAAGWSEVVDQIQINGTPGETADLVMTDGSSIYSTLRIKTYETELNGLAYDGFVEEDLLDNSFDPEGMFADADSKAIAIEAENQTDAYRIPCDVEDENYRDLGLSCTNAYIHDWSNWPTISQTDLATSLSDAIHAESDESTIDDKGLWIGRSQEGDSSKNVYAFMTGTDTSGAAGTSGTVNFTTHHFDGSTYNVVAIKNEGVDVTATWSITEPFSGYAVLAFDIPEFLFKEFDIEWREDPTVILAAIEAGDTQSFLRFGGMKSAGAMEIFQLLNFTALEEVIAGFSYEKPDTDNDNISDDEDNCPVDANANQTDTDGNGIGDACESTQGGDDLDNDGVEDAADNCPSTPNGVNEDNQSNIDNDDFGDACDSDIDGDGTDNGSDPCPNDEFDQCSVSSQDSDQDGVNDDLDPFPFDDSETADADEDGLGDNQDDFPNDASEQFDTDGDGVGDNSDLCPLVASTSQGVNHNDADLDGIGDECDITVSSLEGVWLLSGDPEDTSQVPNDAGDSCVTDDDTGVFYTKAQIKQTGTQVWLHVDEDTFVGTIDANGDFSLEALHDDSPTVISGNYDGSVFTGFGYDESEQITGGTCDGSGTLAMDKGIAVSEELVMTNGGVTWFESDSDEDSSGSQSIEYISGTLTDGAPESMRLYNETSSQWETATNNESNNYLTANGVESADESFTVTGYVDSTGGETMIIKPTDQGIVVDLEISHVDLMEIDLNGLPMLAFLDEGYEHGLDETETFVTGAKGYIATITEQVTAYSFWCDEGWDDDWFNDDQSMNCNNIISIGSVEDGTNADGSTDYDPVPAESFADVISTPSELAAANEQTQARGIWAGNGDNFQIRAYLQTDDGAANGANPTVIYMKDYWNGYQYKVGESAFSTDTIGSTAIITWTLPESVRQLGDRDNREGSHFIFVDQDNIDGASQDVLRRGEIWLANEVEHEFLFNSTARADIESAFSLMAPVPQAFMDATDNGVNFSANATITLGQTFGVEGFGIFREWETASGGEVVEYYIFDSSANSGRYVFEEHDDTESLVDSADEAMTWSVNSEGNLEISITSSTELHQIALEDFSDTYRPQVVVLNPREAIQQQYSERLVSEAVFEFEVANRVSLAAESLEGSSFTFINSDSSSTEVEVMFFNSGGAWEWQVDNIQDDTATWSEDTTENFITLDFGDGTDIIAIEDIYADSEDADGDLDTTEDVYLFTGWYQIDSASGLGSFFRDEFYKN